MRSSRCAYFLDVDGTLVDFADTPAAVTLDRARRRLVQALSRSADGAVALISGRSLASLDRLFGPERWPAAGQHGLERRSASGRVFRHRTSHRRLDQARRQIGAVVAAHPALLLEDKGLSLALHYRRSPRLAPVAHRAMRRARAVVGPGYCLQRGQCVVELLPAGRDKGAAIAAFVREPPFRGRVPIFIGDDVTDEYGFAMVNRLGGYSIKVGRGPTTARLRLRNVREVLSWLERGHPQPARVRRKRTA